MDIFCHLFVLTGIYIINTVLEMFENIKKEARNANRLVIVLIDEVESLTAARRSSMQGNEPSDAMRVVNALLTQLDQIRTLQNVIVLTTSNISEAIDVAFIDRADMKIFIGTPSLVARYAILRSCIKELQRVSI